MTERTRPSLKSFDAYADRNGQDNGEDDPRDVALARRTQADLERDPMGEAETARIASGRTLDDATDATEAETPRENLERIGGGPSGNGPSGKRTKKDADEALDRATASLGKEDR